MKKFVFIVAVALLLGSTASAVELDKPVVQNNKIVLTGMTDNANDSASIIVLKPGISFDELTQSAADSNTVYAKQIIGDSNGKFTVEFGLPDNCGENAIYPVAVFSNGEKKETQFYYIKQNGLDIILNKFNNHEDTVKNLLIHYSSVEPALNITIDEFYENNQATVEAIFEKNRTNLASGQFVSLSEIESAYNSAVATAKLNAITDKALLAEELKTDTDIFNLESDGNMVYDTDNLVELFIKYRKDGFDSALSVQSAYKQAYITAVINKTTDAKIIDEFIIKNASIIGINVNEYSKYKSPSVGSIIAGKNGFGSYTDIKNAVTAAIGELNKKNNQNSVSPGGSTSSSSGKTSNIFIPQPATDNTPQGDENVLFNDLTDVQWAKNAIEYLSKLGIVNGKGNNEFKPNDIILREEFTTMVVRLLSLPIDNTNSDFADVKSNEWYTPYICAAHDAELIFGKDENRFGIGDTITRQEMATILYRCAVKKNITLPENQDLKEFADSDDISDYAKEAVNKLYRAQIISGFEDGLFRARQQSTRAQAAQMLYGIAKVMGI